MGPSSTSSYSAAAERVPSREAVAVSGDLCAGDRVEHDRFGFGQIVSMEGNEPNVKAVVRFESVGTKTLLLKYAKLRKIN